MLARSPAVIVTLGIVLLGCGCIMQREFKLGPIVLASEYYGPRNYSVVMDDLLGDDETVFFYVEATGFRVKKFGGQYEFWLSIDISIGDSEGYLYVEKISEKEYHVTNATEKPAYIYYKYPWYTGNVVRSGTYWVSITAKDKLSGRLAEARKEFQIDLSKPRSEA